MSRSAWRFVGIQRSFRRSTPYRTKAVVMLSELLDDDFYEESGAILWLGPTDGPEFGPCFEPLSEERAVETIEGLAAVAEIDNREEPFDLVVLACPRPLVSLAAAQPLVESVGADSVVQLLGTWCEGEGRTGKTLADVERVFWHQWPTWWRLRNSVAAEQEAKAIPSIEVRSADSELARSLVETLAAEGWGAVGAHCPPAHAPGAQVRNAAALLWDGTQLGGHEASRLATVCASARAEKTPVVVMLDFPRPGTVATAIELGAAAVLGKPFTRETLFDVLSHVIAETKQSKSTPTVDSLSPDQAWSGRFESSLGAKGPALHEAA